MKLVYLVIGCPGAGKSWVCEQAKEHFEYVHHDLFIGMAGMAGDAYVQAILEASQTATRPILAEAPFSVSQIKEPLEQEGFDVVPLFIIEEPEVIAERYLSREGKDIPVGHLTRQETYAERAEEWGAFQGTSSEVLEHLRTLALDFAA